MTSKNAHSCRTEIAAQGSEILALKKEIENLKSSPNDGGGYGSSPSCTDPGDDTYSTGDFQPCCDGRNWERKPCPTTDDSCYYCPDEAEPILVPIDHSAYVKTLTESYFLNETFWFTVPGGRLMQTYQDVRRGDAYDNAMGVQFMIRQKSTVDHGKEILNAFANQMYCDLGQKPDDGWRGKKNTASGEFVQLFPRTFKPESAHQTKPKGSWQEDYAVGNNAYVGLAFAHASTVLAENDENAACYALAAYDIADAIWETRKCPSHDFPKEAFDGANTESMADWVGLLNTLNQHGDYATQVAGTVKFYKDAYNNNNPSYFTSLSCSNYPSGSDFGNGAHPADTTFWSSMADAALTGTKYSDNMINAMKNVLSMVNVENENSDVGHYQGNYYNGFKFSDKAEWIQWEVTASAGAMSMMHSLDKHEEQMRSVGLYDIFQSRNWAYLDSITYLIETTGSVPGSVHSSGSRHFKGESWCYNHIPHLAASSWSGMAMLMADWKDTDAFNVFAAQKGMLSRADAQKQCTNIKQTLAKCIN